MSIAAFPNSPCLLRHFLVSWNLLWFSIFSLVLCICFNLFLSVASTPGHQILRLQAVPLGGVRVLRVLGRQRLRRRLPHGEALSPSPPERGLGRFWERACAGRVAHFGQGFFRFHIQCKLHPLELCSFIYLLEYACACICKKMIINDFQLFFRMKYMKKRSQKLSDLLSSSISRHYYSRSSNLLPPFCIVPLLS